MDAIARIAEERIQRAIEEGQLEGLSGQGRPLEFEDETWIPADLRLAYRMLRNAGFIPPELELRNEIMSLRCLIDSIDDDQERLRRLRELDFKLTRLRLMLNRPVVLDEYETRFAEKFLNP